MEFVSFSTQPSYSQPPYNQGGYTQGYTAPPPPPPPPPAYNYGSYGPYNPAPYTPPPPPTAQTYPQPSYNQYQQVSARWASGEASGSILGRAFRLGFLPIPETWEATCLKLLVSWSLMADE